MATCICIAYVLYMYMYRHKGSTTTHAQITVPLDRQGTHYQSQGQDKQKQDGATPLSYTCVKHGGNTNLIFPTVFYMYNLCAFLL